MFYLRQFSIFLRRTRVLLLFCIFAPASGLLAQAPPAPSPDTSSKPAQTPAAADTAEVSTRDSATTFKVHVNLVLVRVVVRDAHGQIVPNLKKEDFQLFDNRKPQAISSFTVETPGMRTASSAALRSGDSGYSSSADVFQGKAAVLPQRFVSLVFDDIHMSMEDTSFVRDAATRLFAALAPSDRVAMYSTSGELNQEFTGDRSLLQKALLRIIPQPLTSTSNQDCPDVSYYEADLIQNQNDTQALAVAAEDAVQCAFNGDERQIAAAQAMAFAMSARVLAEGDSATEYAYRHMEGIVRRLSTMPGQRILVFISPGFIPSTLLMDASDLVDRATRANIVINTIDARGLYTPDLNGDIASPARDSFRTAGYKTTYRVAAQLAQEDVLAQFADGTGGRFYHNRNDLDEAMREAAAAPAFSYLLGFSPHDLKFDGRYHALKVALVSKQKYDVQARRGYFAPRSPSDPAEATNAEIQEALFSQDEISGLPVDLQTQFFKKDENEVRLSVLMHVDVRAIHFQKTGGRNNDQLTIVTGIFDENGNFVTGGEKIVSMKLLDATYQRLSRSGMTVKSSFDVKPGTYMVRLVVRDSEGAQMAARNGAVVIPY